MRKKKAADSQTPISPVNAYIPKQDKSYAQFKKELQKAGLTDIFELDNILYVHANADDLNETGKTMQRIAENIQYPHSYGLTTKKPSNSIKSIGDARDNGSEE